jgi:hypothetical protein
MALTYFLREQHKAVLKIDGHYVMACHFLSLCVTVNRLTKFLPQVDP